MTTNKISSWIQTQTKAAAKHGTPTPQPLHTNPAPPIHRTHQLQPLQTSLPVHQHVLIRLPRMERVFLLNLPPAPKPCSSPQPQIPIQDQKRSQLSNNQATNMTKNIVESSGLKTHKEGRRITGCDGVGRSSQRGSRMAGRNSMRTPCMHVSLST
jgi:hypothetical protein